MKRTPVAIFVIATGFFIGYEAQSQEAPHTSVRTEGALFQPFTAQQTRRYFSASASKPPVISEHTFARRSDGSYVDRWRVTSPSGETGETVQISDLRQRKDVTLEPFTKSAIVFYLSAAEVLEYRRHQDGCLSANAPATGDIQEASLLNRTVVPVVKRTKIDTTSRWIDRSLNCYPLLETSSFGNGARNEFQVTSLTEGEPPDSLFVVPAEYVERSPGEVDALYHAKYPGYWIFGERLLRVMQPRYFEHLKNRR